MEIYDRDIALEWYKYGLEKKDDFFVKFMMHWVAFNWLYSKYEDIDKMTKGKDTEEWRKIELFCKEHQGRLSRYNAFDSEEIAVFKKQAVRDGRTGELKQHHINRFQGVKNRDIASLIGTLYQVRCNLFHGSKSLRINRDIELVKYSAVILEGYLKVYFGIEE